MTNCQLGATLDAPETPGLSLHPLGRPHGLEMSNRIWKALLYGPLRMWIAQFWCVCQLSSGISSRSALLIV